VTPLATTNTICNIKLKTSGSLVNEFSYSISQNRNGGFASYELTRSSAWLEVKLLYFLLNEKVYLDQFFNDPVDCCHRKWIQLKHLKISWSIISMF